LSATAGPPEPGPGPRLAGAAGIVFAILLAVTIVLIRSVFPVLPPAATVWHASSSSRTALRVALALLPFAGIAFLWFMGALRAYSGEPEDKFFATVFLGGGLLFVAALFALATSAGSMLAMSALPWEADRPELWGYGRHFTFTLLSGYCMRMAAVFAFSTTAIGRRRGLFPRWLVLLGYLVGLILLFAVTEVPWSEMVFPFWVFLVSCRILTASRSPHAA
jgi:hypothetical protein